MSKLPLKESYPVSRIRRFLEPGPVVLVSSRWKGQDNIMTMGWHTIMEFTPSLIGCMITASNHSFEMIRKSGECVVNLPTADIAETVVKIGNCHGNEVDKFAEFGLTSVKATKVKAPMIAECHANFECKLVDTRMISKYNFFIFECVKAHAAPRPKYPKTIHYRGDGEFMICGENKSLRRLFRPEML